MSNDVNGTENHVLWKDVMKNILLPVMQVMAAASQLSNCLVLLLYYSTDYLIPEHKVT
jgi:hypothetical protein